MANTQSTAKNFIVQNPIVSIALLAVASFGGVRLYKTVFNKPRIPIVPPIPPVPDGKGNKYSYISQQYADFADGLADAMSGAGTDETAIKIIMSKMKTRDDVLALIDQYGKRSVKTPYGWDSDPMTLAQSFNYELTADELETYVNSAIKKTGYKF
jgi:hypothetical protein